MSILNIKIVYHILDGFLDISHFYIGPDSRIRTFLFANYLNKFFSLAHLVFRVVECENDKISRQRGYRV